MYKRILHLLELFMPIAPVGTDLENMTETIEQFSGPDLLRGSLHQIAPTLTLGVCNEVSQACYSES